MCITGRTWYCKIKCFPANTSTLKQRWSSTFINVETTSFVENESWTDTHLSTLFQRWQNNVETTSIELRWFNFDEQMLFQRWNLVEIESWADVCLSTLFQHWQNNVETTLRVLRQFNVNNPILFQRWYLVENESWINVCSSVLLRRWENSIETTLSMDALICTDVH